MSKRVYNEEVRSRMAARERIRNLSIVAHVDHGKTTLSDSMLRFCGINARGRTLDGKAEEQERGITIKSASIALNYELEGEKFLVNLIDSPGHVDFSSEVTAALRLTDGALVVVDCIEGVCVQTETVLSQALENRVRPVAIVNKMDRLILEKQLTPEEIYQSCVANVAALNQVLATFGGERSGAYEVRELDPLDDTVCFGSAKQGWAFTLGDIARFYAGRLGVDEAKLRRRLWGEHYFDARTRKWSKRSVAADGTPLVRGFVHFAMGPICKLFAAVMGEEHAEVDRMLERLDVRVPKEMRDKALPKDLLARIMSTWLHAGRSVMRMCVTKLPSPATAQAYRTPLLYSGDMEDEAAQAMARCDPDGPVMVYVAKMIPSEDASRFVAFGRVFSGTLRTGGTVHVLDNEYVRGGSKGKRTRRSVQLAVMMGSSTEPVGAVPAGNTIGITNIDGMLLKSGTVTSADDVAPFVPMRFCVSPVVRVAVEAKRASDTVKLVVGLQRLAKSDQTVLVETDGDTGEMVIAAAGELHLETCLTDLRDYCRGIELRVSEPRVPYRETVADVGAACLARSTNKHNRFTVTAQPLRAELVDELAQGRYAVYSTHRARSEEARAQVRRLADEHGWDANAARKVWAIGPEGAQGGGDATNVLVDSTAGVAYLSEARDSVAHGFHNVASRGVIANEPLRGVRFNLTDATLHQDSIHRSTGAVGGAMSRACLAAVTAAGPRLVEPVFGIEVQCPGHAVGAVYSCIAQRRGSVVEERQKEGSPLFVLRGHLPVADSFGFNGFLRGATGGSAFPTMYFSHWETVDSDPFEEGSRAHVIACELRKSKGLGPLPTREETLSKFCDAMPKA